MKSLFKAAALAAALSLLTPAVALSARSLRQQGELAAPLTNKDVIEMVRAKVPEEIIIEKIKSSPCKFDRSVDAIIKLQEGGVTKAVMLAMLDAPYGMPKLAPAPPPEPKPAPDPTPAAVHAATNQPRTISDALPAYGDASELRGLRKVYITADEPTSRDWIRGVFNKYEGLIVVNSPEEAEFFIECGVKSSTESRGRQRSHYLRQQMIAFTLDESGRKRILWYENETYEESGGFSFSRPNEVNMAMHFVSMMKKMRGGQKYNGQGRSAAL